ncbi:MAG TPA: glutamate-5-semialdehyde dehydrogenase [Polyangiaceae bacterium]
MTEADVRESMRVLATGARAAARELAKAGRAQKDAALHAIAKRLRAGAPALLEANRADVSRFRESGSATPAFIDRLTLTEQRLEGVARGVLEIAAQDDPVGAVTGMTRRPNGLLVGQVRIPLGVIAMIYEARPNVTVDAAALCIKSGNAVLLRGGSEAAHSNAALGALLREGLSDVGLAADAVQIVPPGDREAMRALLGLSGLVDLVIPRGGEGLVRFVTEHAKVPVIQHYQGVCHLYVDEGADLSLAVRLVVDGKTVRPGVCNALECLLVHEREAKTLLPAVEAMAIEKGVELRGCPRTLGIISRAVAAAPSDYGREFLDKILAVRVVTRLDEALAHVSQYGSGHTEAICTPSYESAQRWLREVDASCVLVNASTRFNDGGELGLGAEIGISTSKLHAFGPMGIESLTTKKWIVYGEGQVRG